MLTLLLGYQLQQNTMTECQSWLAPEEVALAEGFSPKRARQFCHGRALTRRLLHHFCGLTPDHCVIDLPSTTAPTLQIRQQPCHFSISHSSEAVAVVIGFSQPVGLDIECLKPRDYYALSDAMPALQGAHCQRSFYQRWTMLEATAKLTGQPLHQLLIQQRLPEPHCKYLELDNYLLCLATNHSEIQLQILPC